MKQAVANGVRKYMAGDLLEVGIRIKHRANLIAATVIFSHQAGNQFVLDWKRDDFTDPNEGMRLPDGDRSTSFMLSGRIGGEVAPGIYGVTGIELQTAGGHLIKLIGEDLGDILSAAVEIVEEPVPYTSVETLWFPSDDEPES